MLNDALCLIKELTWLDLTLFPLFFLSKIGMKSCLYVQTVNNSKENIYNMHNTTCMCYLLPVFLLSKILGIHFRDLDSSQRSVEPRAQM